MDDVLIAAPKPSLLDDIDKPIFRTIALLNLYGLKTSWTCCGFNYKDQPYWKSHTYGRPYFAFTIPSYKKLKDLTVVQKICKLIDNDIFSNSGIWVMAIKRRQQQGMSAQIGCYFSPEKGDWNDPRCIHSYEVIISAIEYLNQEILKHKKKFASEACLSDFNRHMRENTPLKDNWQFEPKEDWIIKKSDWV